MTDGVIKFSNAEGVTAYNRYPNLLTTYGDFGAIQRIGYYLGDGTFNAPVFSSIPQTYQDLMFVVYGRGTTAATTSQGVLRLNDDAGSNYSWTSLIGDGSSATSTRDVNSGNGFTINNFTAANSTANRFATAVVHILNYRGSVFKTVLWQNADDNNGSGTTRIAAGLWRSTAAINDVRLINAQANWASGCTFALYGIKANNS